MTIDRLVAVETRREPVPVIDIFAGPGGLAEGFGSLRDRRGRAAFDIRLSIEKDPAARATLALRSFFRKFPPGKVPEAYYSYLRGEIDQRALYSAFPEQHRQAEMEAWCATLGRTDAGLVKERINEALRGAAYWVLLGGPPCQVYSNVGRSRMRRHRGIDFDRDERHFMYREYLRILKDHAPAAFIFENVKGLLSARVRGDNTFELILRDLKNPSRVDLDGPDTAGQRAGPAYTLFSIDGQRGRHSLWDEARRPQEFVVRSERYGIPQKRHRVIVFGIRDDLLASLQGFIPAKLVEMKPIALEEVIDDLPRLRSRVSGSFDSPRYWLETVRGTVGDTVVWHEISRSNGQAWGPTIEVIDATLAAMTSSTPGTGGRFTVGRVGPSHEPNWFLDPRLEGVCNHEARAHMPTDLQRYLYAACYGLVRGHSPKLADFPYQLLPAHRNARRSLGDDLFSDRFRVQIRGRPATTITSHIARDGHYFIHYDPSQCRSLTVREAARIQTFPDNYFFEGHRTQQYIQVGNAVPPLLARQIAAIVKDLILALRRARNPGPEERSA